MAAADPDPYAPFRPRATRIACLVIAVWLITGLAVLVVVLNRLEEPRLPDQVAAAVIVALVCAFLARQAGVKAVPSADGLMVRNVFLTHRLEWAEIVSVRFGERDWVLLDLADGSTLAVMAIQRVDGKRGRAAASRLASLVAAHEPRGGG
ncbi:PH domain-containing protein [Occultella glacieicola]|uniref:PH domain-containing protein n=1 Tax=Occultella glacieicola TaxID=2518684 RepID=A0ABY2E512_9MICO|nr:PH domain-containing protein [Occultella glacieicola]TDE92512.1 PH domain-containing protein [Occultella glacieicola]